MKKSKSGAGQSGGLRRSRFLLRAGALVGAGSMLLAACSSSSSSSSSSSASASGSSSKSPYVVHAVLSETGSAGFLGSLEAKSLTALTAYENKHGGIDGHPISLDMKDNQSSPSVAVSIATPWVTSGVPFILDGSVVAADAPVDALAGPNGPVMWDLSPGVHPKAGSYVWSAGISTSSDAEAYLNFLKAKGLTRIAAITSTDGSGTDGWNQLQAQLKNPQYSGFTVLTHQTFDPTDVSVTTQLSVIKADNPQAIVVWTTGTPVGTVFKGMAALGMLNIPTVTTDGNAIPTELESFASVMPKNLYIPTGALYLSPSLLSGGEKTAISDFDTAIQAVGGSPNDGWGLSASAFLIMIDAVRALGVNATAVQLHNYLQTKIKNYPGVFGVYNMSESDHRGVHASAIDMTDWNGKSFVPVSGPAGIGAPPT
jgi:branched-chain amino acid transport system substrate-binding protein